MDMTPLSFSFLKKLVFEYLLTLKAVVVVGVVLRRVEQYNLVKIKPMLMIKWKLQFWVASRSLRINQWQCSILGFVIGWFFHFCFRLWQPNFHWIMSNEVVNRIERNRNVLILPTLIPLSLWLCSRLRFMTPDLQLCLRIRCKWKPALRRLERVFRCTRARNLHQDAHVS